MTPSLKRADHVLNSHLHLAWKRAIGDGRDPILTVEREERVFVLVAQVDPDDGKHLAWLSVWRRRQWDVLGVGVPCALEQLDELREALVAFSRSRLALPPDMRDIGRYQTPEELAATALMGSDAREASLREEAEAEASAGSQLLFDQPPWQLVGLRTKAAARWWGMGTRWCTASTNSYHFDRYATAGGLLVLTTPSGRYQLHQPTGEFRDALDHHADLAAVLRGAPQQLKALMADIAR